MNTKNELTGGNATETSTSASASSRGEAVPSDAVPVSREAGQLTSNVSRERA